MVQDTEQSATAATAPAPAKTTPAPARRVVLLVATRKGAWLYHGDPARFSWRVDGPHFLGHIISHLKLDPRDGRTLLAAAKTDEQGRSVDHSFWLTPALRRRACSARTTAASTGRLSPA